MPFYKTANTRHGDFDIFIDPLKNGGVDETIYDTGTWEPHVSRVLEILLKSGGVLVDIGANIGFHSLNVAKIFNNIIVHAFEPNLDIADQFAKSIQRNCLSNITIHRVGLSDVAEESTLYIRDENTGGSSLNPIVPEVDFRVYHSVQITLRRLDDEISEAVKVDVIKIDVEGHEYEALRSSARILGRWHPVTVMEFSPAFYEADYIGKSVDFIKYLREFGYSFFETQTLKPIDLYDRISNIGLNVSQIDIVCISQQDSLRKLFVEQLSEFS